MRFRVRLVMTSVFFILFGLVAANFFKISVIQNEKYQNMANSQHFGSISISANRGTIYDANGHILAKSASVYKVFLDPVHFREDLVTLQKKIDKRNEDKKNGAYTPEYDEKGVEINALPESADAFRTATVTFLAEKLGISTDKVSKAMDENNQYSVLQEQVEKPVADEVLEYFSNMGFVSINVEEDTKRYYPQNEQAAAVIGFTSRDGNGLYGVESYYDEYLSGIDGRTISAKDSNGNELPYKYSKTYSAKNGNDVYLTIDTEIQAYLENHLEEMVNKFEISNRACAILMNAKTGAIYGMATYPGFDLNDPYKVSDDRITERARYILESEGETIDEDSLTGTAREMQWRNKCVTETYEPGSVFKVVTSASAIEENLIDLNKDSFFCSGSVQLDGMVQPIYCHEKSGHGAQTFQDALTHSCNPAFIEVGRRLGVEKFCYYFDAFGLREPTGIDLPAESGGVQVSAKNMTNVDLAESAFGQCETITPLEMITAYCAVINGGYLLQPYVVDKVLDEDGNVVLKNSRTVRRQVVSEDTSATMRECLKRVVTDNNGGNVTIKGYSIGGKSGTSQRLSQTSKHSTTKLDEEENADEQEYGASYVCFTPAEDPELILLVLADMPNKQLGYYGSTVAVPTARDILTDVLPYMGYYPEYTAEEVENLDVKIPLLEGSLEDAKKTLEGLGITPVIVGNGIEVVAQSPLTGSTISKNGTVYLYTENNHTSEMTTVPDLRGLTAAEANDSIEYSKLNYVAYGASIQRADAAVNSQSIEPGTQVAVGTTIELEFIVNADSD